MRKVYRWRATAPRAAVFELAHGLRLVSVAFPGVGHLCLGYPVSGLALAGNRARGLFVYRDRRVHPGRRLVVPRRQPIV